MAADRNPPTPENMVSISGADFARRIAEEILALYAGRINQVGTVSGSANAITGACTPPLADDYQHGETFRFTPGGNNSSTVTVNWDSRGAKALVDEDGNALGADDLVSGRPQLCWYHSGDDHFRLGAPTVQDLLAALNSQVEAVSKWTILGDTQVGSAVANIEHSFSAGDYTEIIGVVMGLSPASGSQDLTADLRYASGSVLAVTTGTSSAIGASHLVSVEARFVVDVSSASTKHHSAMLWGSYSSGDIPAQKARVDSANVPDRVRYSFAANTDAGRIITYGLKKS